MSAALQTAKEIVESVPKFLSFSVLDENTSYLLKFGIPILLIFGIFLYWIITAFILKPSIESVNLVTLAVQRDAVEKLGYTGTKSLNTTITESALTNNEKYLINLQPLTCTVGGYIGPMEDGSFDPDTFLDASLKAGIRSYVLPISVHNDASKGVKDGWPEAGKPGILFRKGGVIGNNNVVRSVNGMRIKQFMDALLLRLGQNEGQNGEPILIFLKAYQGSIPDSSTQEKDYVRLLNDMAKELQSISGLTNYRLTTLGQFGSATGGQAASKILLETPLEQLRNKILFFTDFPLAPLNKDVYSKERVAAGIPSFADFINFTVTPFSATPDSSSNPQPNIVAASASQSAVKSMSVGDVLGSKIPWSEQSRTTFMISSNDSAYEFQSKEAVEASLKAGIQMIPIPFFYLNTEIGLTQQKSLFDLWQKGAYLVKGKDIRYTKPEPIVPAPPNPTFRAAVPGAPPGGLALQ